MTHLMSTNPKNRQARRSARLLDAGLLAMALAGLSSGWHSGAAAQEAYESWPVIQPSFPSTGGGGIMIGGYNPVVTGSVCSTPFTATEPNGTVHQNIVEFDAIATHGGTLCQNGRWRSADGTSSGTTPFRVFIKNGVARGSP
jgi:hypothetical protein